MFHRCAAIATIGLILAIAIVCGTPADATILGHWGFDSSAELGLNSVTGASLTAQGDAQHTAAGYAGGALLVDGAGDYLGGSPYVPIGDSPYTMSAWIKPDVTGGRGIVGWGNYGQGRRVNAFRLNGDNGFRHYWWGADIDRDAAAAGVDLDDGAWHHVVATYNGDTRALYVDGTPIGSDSPGDDNATDANFRIASTNNGEWFDGTIDEVAVWNQGLSGNQIRALAGGTAPATLPGTDTLVAHWVADDYSGGNWVDRVGSVAAVIEDNPTGQGNQLNGHAVVNFDGNDAFRVAAAGSPMAQAGDFTLTTVFRTTTAGVGDETSGWWNNSGIVDMEMPGWVQDWGLVINSQSSIGVGLGGGWPNQITLPSAQTGLNDGQAHVAVYTRQGGTVTLFVDGVAVTQTNNGGGMALERLANQFTIGRRQTGGNFYTGDLAEIQLHDGRLTAGEAQLATMDLARTYGFAGAKAWVGGTGPWGTGGNWTGGTVPAPLDDATIDNGGTAQLGGGTAVAGSLTIGGTTGGTLDWTGGALDTWDIAVLDNGTLNRNAGNWTYTGRLNVDNGTVNLNGGGLSLNDGGNMHLSGTGSFGGVPWIVVGEFGATGTMQTITVADTAQLNAGTWFVVGKNGRKGTIVQSGGDVQAVNMWVGEFGTSEGRYELSGGTLTATDRIYVGKEYGTVGTLDVSNGVLNVNNVIRVGNDGFGMVNQTGGAIRSNAWVTLGEGGNGVGIYNMSGGLLQAGLTSSTEITVGVNGEGTFNISGTARVAAGGTTSFVVGKEANSSGLVNQSGGLVTVNGNPQIGRYSTGTFNQHAGVFYHVRHMAIGRYGSGRGTYNLTGAGPALSVGRWLIVAEDAGAVGEMTVDGLSQVSLGGSSATSPSLEVARNGTGTLTQLGGSVYADTVRITGGSSGTGTYNLQGGDLETREITFGSGTAAFNFTGGTLRPGLVGFSLANDGGTLEVATPATAGLNARWYTGNQMTDDPGAWDPATTPVYSTVVDAVEWGGSPLPPGVPGDYFGTVYTGYLYTPWDGDYSFRERVDDAAILYIDGSEVLNDTDQSTSPWTTHTWATVPLNAGWHSVEFRYSDHWGGQSTYLEWDPAGAEDWSLLVGGAVFADLGDNIGETIINGDYTQDAGGTLAIEIEGTGTPGVDYDLLTVGGNAELEGQLLVDLVSFVPRVGDTFDVVAAPAGLIDADALTPFTADPLLNHWTLSVLSDGGSGEILRLTFVPEPSTWTLAAMGLVGLLVCLRRRRND